jgi:PhnB protein
MNLTLEFIVNKENNTINVKRTFAANLDLVWEAWTNPEILDQWWAPKPYRTETIKMDFKIGGRWFYAMISPEGEKHFCIADYKDIDLHKSFSGLDAFCDENENINELMPRLLWNNEFIDQGETTEVNITVKYNSLEDLEMVIKMGFKDGFTMALGNLDEYFATQLKLKN